MADRVGQLLGNYRLVRLLGSGGFADVYLGEHVHIPTMKAAIKVLHTQITDEEIAKFRSEAGTLAGLIHPQIVRLLDFGIEEKIPFLVMDYAPNGTFREKYPRSKTLPLPSIVAYVSQIAAALQFAHEEKLIHRDIKPENIFLGRRNEVVVGDFGVAVLIHTTRSQSLQDIAGTAAYMAPEQMAGKPNRASDQYSLGIMVYEWLTGDVPFQGSFIEILTQQLAASPESLRTKVPTIPLAVEEVVLRALEKDPQKRFPSVQEFAQALKVAVGQRTVPPPYTPPIPPSPAPETQGYSFTYRPAQAAAPKSKEQWLTEGNTLSKARHYREAIACFDKAIALDTAYGFAYFNRGNAYRDIKEYSRALLDFDRYIQLTTNDADAYNNRGLTYYDLKEYRRAIADYDRAIAVEPNHLYAHFNRGNAHRDLKEYQKAIADYDRASVLNPKYIKVYNNRGLTYFNLRNYAKAIAEYTQAIALDATYALAYYNRGNAYREMKDYTRAIADYDHYIQLDPHDSDAYNNRGNTYYDLKDYRRAIADYDEASRIAPHSAMPFRNRGLAYNALAEYQRAISDFDEAIRLDPKNATAYYSRGKAYRELKEYTRALVDYDSSIERDPNYAWAFSGRGETYRLLKQYNRAIADFNSAIALDPNYAWAYGSRGQTFAALQQYPRAIADFDHALTLDASLTWVKTARDAAQGRV